MSLFLREGGLVGIAGFGSKARWSVLCELVGSFGENAFSKMHFSGWETRNRAAEITAMLWVNGDRMVHR
jgi:hypothetical protein